MDGSPNSGLPESKVDLATQYKIAFEAWQFQVNSYWQRNSYFAAFQSVAIAGAWKILGHRSAIALCAAGILLVAVWYINNLIVHSYIRYWWASIGELERTGVTRFPLVADYEHRRWDLVGRRFSFLPYPRIIRRFVRYSTTINAIPLLFLFGWLWMLNLSIHAVTPEGVKISESAPKVNNSFIAPPKPVSAPPGALIPETQSPSSQIAPKETGSSSSEGQEPAEQFKGYTQLPIPNSLYGAGLAYGIDREGNQYLLSDLIHEAGLKINSTAPPFTSFPVSISQDELERVIDQNRWGDLVSRVLFVVKVAAQKWGAAVGDAQLKVVDVTATKTDLENAWPAIRETPFWRQRHNDFAGMRLFLVAETISSHRVFLNFPNTKAEVLNQAFGELLKLGPETFVKQGATSIEIVSRLPLILAYKAAELDTKNSSRNPSPNHLLMARLERHEGWRSSLVPAVQKEQPVAPVLELLPSTHYTDGPPRLISFAGNATYGAILNDLKGKILGSGINEIRIYDSGYGFAIATRFEVTDQNGIPSAGQARFLPRRAEGKRLRGYFITVTAHPKPNAYISTKHPQELFSMKYGIAALPDGMAEIPIEPGTTVRVFVLEFENKSGIERELQNQECASSAQAHMTQSGILK